MLNQYVDAELLLKKVIQLEPKNADALANLSAIEEKQNNLTFATQYAEKALTINSTNIIARLTLSNIHFRNEYSHFFFFFLFLFFFAFFVSSKSALASPPALTVTSCVVFPRDSCHA